MSVNRSLEFAVIAANATPDVQYRLRQRLSRYFLFRPGPMDEVGEPPADRKHAAHRFGFDRVESGICTERRRTELEAAQKMIEPRARPWARPASVSKTNE